METSSSPRALHAARQRSRGSFRFSMTRATRPERGRSVRGWGVRGGALVGIPRGPITQVCRRLGTPLLYPASQGFLNPTLYAHPEVLTDITSGSSKITPTPDSASWTQWTGRRWRVTEMRGRGVGRASSVRLRRTHLRLTRPVLPHPNSRNLIPSDPQPAFPLFKCVCRQLRLDRVADDDRLGSCDGSRHAQLPQAARPCTRSSVTGAYAYVRSIENNSS